jgi:hypothetical protein
MFEHQITNSKQIPINKHKVPNKRLDGVRRSLVLVIPAKQTGGQAIIVI